MNDIGLADRVARMTFCLLGMRVHDLLDIKDAA